MKNVNEKPQSYVSMYNAPILETIGHQFSLGHLVKPVEFPPRVLAAIESCESVDASLQLGWKGKYARLLEWPRTTAKNLEDAEKKRNFFFTKIYFDSSAYSFLRSSWLFPKVLLT